MSKHLSVRGVKMMLSQAGIDTHQLTFTRHDLVSFSDKWRCSVKARWRSGLGSRAGYSVSVRALL